MYRNIYFFILSLLAVACTEVTVLPSSDGGNPSHVPTVSVPLQLSASGMRIEQVQVGADGGALQSPTSTRASGSDVVQNEGEVQDVCVFQFGSDGKLAYKQYFQQLDVNTPSEKWVDILLRTDVGAGHYYVLVNVGDVTADYAVDTTDEAAFTAHMLPTKLDNGRLLEGYLPMSGKTAKAVDPTKFNFSSGVAAHTNKIEVSLTRMVAKVELTLTKNSLFTPSRVTLRDVPTGLDFAAPATGTTTQPATHRYEPVSVTTGTGGETIYTWYMPENLRGEAVGVTDLTQRYEDTAPEASTYILVGGMYEGTEVLYTLYLGSGTRTKPNDFNVRRNTYYKVSAHVRGAGMVDKRVAHVINLSETDYANCYLTNRSGQWYKLRATVRGNGAATAADISPTGEKLPEGETLSPAWGELVWETIGHKQVVSVVDLDRNVVGDLYFKTGPAKEGNAVVCVKDGTAEDSNILWSWHIWHSGLALDDFNEENETVLTYQTNPRAVSGYHKPASRSLRVMDRNLGASSGTPSWTEEVVKTFGLLYQWGRKDPFVGASTKSLTQHVDIFDKDGNKAGTTEQITVGRYLASASSAWDIAASVSYSISHPEQFIAPIDAGYNWIPNALKGTDVLHKANRLWGGDAGTMSLDFSFSGKSIYDPCPAGWCVAPVDTWTNFTTGIYLANSGYNTVLEENKNFASYSEMPYWGRRFYIAGTSGTLCFYPAAGIRWYQNGGVFSRYGACWASSPLSQDNIYGGDWGFSYDLVYAVDSNDDLRGSGYSVRCVREEDALANKHLNP